MIISRGVHPPEAMMHFPPVSDFPPFPKHFSDSVDNFPNFTFSRKISQFSSAKISENYYFPLLLQIFPYFYKFLSVFGKFTCFFTYFMFISFPLYFDHEAFMHHTMHVLDAPDYKGARSGLAVACWTAK